MDGGGDGAVQRERVEACDAGAEDSAGGDGGDCGAGGLCGDVVARWKPTSQNRDVGHAHPEWWLAIKSNSDRGVLGRCRVAGDR